jgi:hypothetical protein
MSAEPSYLELAGRATPEDVETIGKLIYGPDADIRMLVRALFFYGVFGGKNPLFFDKVRDGLSTRASHDDRQVRIACGAAAIEAAPGLPGISDVFRDDLLARLVKDPDDVVRDWALRSIRDYELTLTPGLLSSIRDVAAGKGDPPPDKDLQELAERVLAGPGPALDS